MAHPFLHFSPVDTQGPGQLPLEVLAWLLSLLGLQAHLLPHLTQVWGCTSELSPPPPGPLCSCPVTGVLAAAGAQVGCLWMDPQLEKMGWSLRGLLHIFHLARVHQSWDPR